MLKHDTIRPESQANFPHSTLAALAGGVVAAAIGGAFGKDLAQSFFAREPDPRSREVLSRLASDINKHVPMTVDQETELLNVLGLEGTIVYNYRLVNVSASEIDSAAFVKEMEPGIRNSVCTTPETRDGFLKKGITMRYSYSDKDRAHMATLEILPESCDF